MPDKLKNNNVKVSVMGGMHLKKLNINLLKNTDFDAIIHEGGVDNRNSFSLENIRREPIFIPGFRLYCYLLKKCQNQFGGDDIESLDSFATDRKIPLYPVDVSITDLVNFIYTPINFLIALGIFFVLYSIFHNSPLSLLLSWISPYLSYFVSWALIIVLLFIFYVGYAAWRTTSFRNKVMVTKMISLINKNGYKSVLFYAGSCHKDGVFNLLKNENFDVQKLKI